MGKGLLPAADRLVDRVNRLVRAGMDNIHERNEFVSAPRTPEQAMFLVRDRLGKLIVERRQLERHIASLPDASSDLTAKAETAVRYGRDDLARAALAAAHRLNADRVSLTRELAATDADIALLEQAIIQISAGQVPADTSTRALLRELDRLARDAAKPDSDA
jgi:phage shock protein A